MVYREVQVVIIHVAAVDVDLSDEIPPDPRPVFLEVVPEIESVVAHVEGDLSIYLAAQPIPDRAGIPVLSHRPVRGVPRGDLFPRPNVITQYCLEPTHLPHRQCDLSIRISRERSNQPGP